MLMTDEDIQSKLILKAELVALREELDQMYYSSKNGAGKEFEIFLQLKAAKTEFLEQEYERLKAHGFFTEVITQLNSVVEDEEERFRLIDEKQESIKRKAQMYGKNEIVTAIVELMD